MSITARTESSYLIISNKEKCKLALAKSILSDEEKIDFLISLHIVMEVSLNSLFRNLSLMQIQKSINQHEIAENIDKVSFIDKTVLFIYNYHYDFQGKIDEADRYHSIIGKLRNFSETRNRLLHGHSISTIYKDDGQQQNSKAKNLLSDSAVVAQMKLFKDIFEGIRFYLDHIKSSLTESGKDSLKISYLDDSFLT
jgi:hypothetical protein